MTQDEKNGCLNYIREFIKPTDDTLKKIEKVKFNRPILIIGNDREQVEQALKYIHTVIENPPDNLNPSTEKLIEEINKLKLHTDDGLMQHVVDAKRI